MKRITVVILTVVSLLAASSGRGFSVDYKRISDTTMNLGFTVEEHKIVEVIENGVKYSKIEFGGSVVTNEKGYAELPRFASAVQLKDDKNVTMKYSSESYTDYQLDYPLLPSRGIITRSQNPSDIPYEIANESVTDSWYPGDITQITDPFILRDVRGSSIVFQPFQYNAEKMILRVYDKINVELTDDDTKAVNPLVRENSSVISEMAGMYSSLFVNYNETKALSAGEEGEILLVYTSSNGGLTALQPYIQWKEEMGIKVNTLQVANGTDLSTTSDIQDAYDANNNILYVQLVGDWANLKSAYLYSTTSTYGSQDPMLGCVVGTDQYIDIFVGRISAQSESDVTNQINKAINYEKNPQISGAWYSKALGISSDEGTGDDSEYDYEHEEIIGTNKLLPFTYDTVNYASVEYGDNAADVTGYVNTGLSLINYTGHGSYDQWQTPYFYNSNVSALSNGSQLPFIVSVACLVGQVSWSSGDCFAETWLKHTSGGAVVGMFSSISQPWVPPMVGQDYFNDILVGGYDYDTQPGSGINITEHRTHFGSIACNATNMMLFENPTDASTKDTQEAWNIFGDVSLQVRTDQPILIDNSETTLLIGNYTTTVTSDGSPVEGARVTLYKDGEFVTGFTNSSGTVSLDHSFNVADDVTLTITGFNLETEQSVMMVTGDIGGTFAINQTSISYGSIDAGSTSVQQFQITNSHASETLTGSITTPAGYSVAVASKAFTKDVKNTISYSVAPQSSKTFDLTFAPTAGQTYSGDVTITSTDTNTPAASISVSGTGIVPEINLPVTSLAASASPGNTAVKHFDIENVGEGALSYSMSINYTSGKDAKGSGGPDTYGYKWLDSDETNGPVYSWIDITGVGTSIALSDDGESSSISMGMTFNFYGVDYTSLVIGSNGAVMFNGTDLPYTNLSIPTSTTPNGVIALIWDDLNPASGNNIYYYHDTANSRFIVSYINIPHYNTTSYNTAQILLYESGKIVYQYQEVGSSSVSTCTVGIESGDGLDGTQVVYNAAYLKNDFAIQFSATPEWLSLDSTSGTVPGTDSVEISATCDASELDYGVYTADITVTSNDGDEPTIVIPVTFTVADVLSAPENTAVVTATASEVNLGWDAVSGATVYYIYRSSTDPYSGFTQIGSSGTNSYQDTDVLSGNRYFYYITADSAKK